MHLFWQQGDDNGGTEARVYCPGGNPIPEQILSRRNRLDIKMTFHEGAQGKFYAEYQSLKFRSVQNHSTPGNKNHRVEFGQWRSAFGISVRPAYSIKS